MPNLSLEELQQRWDNLRTRLRAHLPDAGGVMIFSRLNIYYLTGTFGNGVLWLPLDSSPVLMCRRGLERTRAESPIKEIHSFKSYREISDILRAVGSPLPETIGAEMNGLSWALASAFMKHLGHHKVVNADPVIGMARALKTPLEISLLKEAGQRHNRCLYELLPSLIRPGMTEMQIVRVLSDLFFEQGHHGVLRMEKFGEEVYMGHISSGESGNYSSVFNGPLGLRGLHPSVPHMGSPDKVWAKGEVLMIDNGFTYQGYQTDKSQLYWAGSIAELPKSARDAYAFCIEMQAWVASELKPGAMPSDIWAHCLDWAGRAGFGEGFMALPENKVSFVGHGIGLAIDEYPVLAKGFDLPLEDGMALAIEPKIGIRDLGMVGIENTFLVTPSGGLSITGDQFDIRCV